MSAFAFSITKEKIIILSDGRAEKDGQLFATDRKKVHRINDHLGMMWIGCAGALAPWIIETLNVTDIEEYANLTGDLIRYGLEKKGFDIGSLDTHRRYMCVIIGYDKGEPKVFQLDSQEPEMRFTPRNVPVEWGQMGCHANKHDAVDMPYERLVVEKYMPKYGDAEIASVGAFTQMVRDYEANGEPIGGQIFYEVLTPHKVSKFRSVLNMN